MLATELQSSCIQNRNKSHFLSKKQPMCNALFLMKRGDGPSHPQVYGLCESGVLKFRAYYFIKN